MHLMKNVRGALLNNVICAMHIVMPFIGHYVNVFHSYHVHDFYSKCRSIPLQDNIKWEQEIERISKQIDGFSGREIAKLAVAWQVN